MKRFIRCLIFTYIAWTPRAHLNGMVLVSKKSIIECIKCFSSASIPQSIGFEIIKHITLTEIHKALEESIVTLYPETMCIELLNGYRTITTFNKNIMPSDTDLSNLFAYICEKEKINLIEFTDIDGNTLLHCFNMPETKRINYQIISKAIHAVLYTAGPNIEKLIQKGNIFRVDTLQLAARSKRFDVIKSILSMPGINTEKIALSKDYSGDTILHTAAYRNHVKIIKKLFLLPGINIKKLAMACNNLEKTPLHCLIKNKYHKTAQAMLYAPNVNVEALILAKDTMGYTVLHYAVLMNDLESLNLLTHLPNVDYDKVVTAQNNDGKTALHLAAKTRNVIMSKALLGIPKIDIQNFVKIKDLRGSTAFDHAYVNDQSELIKILKPFFQ